MRCFSFRRPRRSPRRRRRPRWARAQRLRCRPRPPPGHPARRQRANVRFEAVLVCFTPRSGRKTRPWRTSVPDPKQTFIGLFCLAGVDRKPGVVVPLDHPPLPTTIWAVWSRRTRFSIWLARCSQATVGPRMLVTGFSASTPAPASGPRIFGPGPSSWQRYRGS